MTNEEKNFLLFADKRENHFLRHFRKIDTQKSQNDEPSVLAFWINNISLVETERLHKWLITQTSPVGLSTGFSIYAGSSYIASDIRDKTDVADLGYGLSTIMKLRPVEYRYDYRDWYKDEDGNRIEKDGSKVSDAVNYGQGHSGTTSNDRRPSQGDCRTQSQINKTPEELSFGVFL